MSYTKLFNWAIDAIRQPKIIDARLDAEFGAISTTLATGPVSSLNGQTGALALRFSPGGRLTLATGIQVMQASYSAQGTVFYTPDQHDQVPLYDGTNIIPTTFTETSQATTDTTKSPAAVAANKNYDMFFSAGNNCTRGPTWNSGAVAGSDTARGTGAGSTELVFVRGLWLNANAITNGPAAQRGTYVGTIRSNGSSLIDYNYASAGSGGVAGALHVWNAYNQARIVSICQDTGVNYNYTTNTIRQARASAGNQISFIRGSADSGFVASMGMQILTANATFTGAIAGIGLDSTTTFTTQAGVFFSNGAVNTGKINMNVPLNTTIGYHTISLNESGDGINANTLNADSLAWLGIDIWQ